MKTTLFIALFSLSALFAKAQQPVEVIKWPALKNYIEKDNGTIKIINFWATWCKPCIQELPDFEKIHLDYKDKNVEVILVSLDQASLAETKVKASLAKNNITAKVILLDEVDFNKWIDQIDPSWSGAIPATLIVHQKTTTRQFYESQFSYEKLKQTIESISK